MVGAFGERKFSEDFADHDADGFGRTRGGLAQQGLELDEDLSIGFATVCAIHCRAVTTPLWE
ncbi:hypothetical protein IVB30_07810 [Bradyrhizobium sp. 200]|uniref:hypothetical protein n=1 Tax=Bradyrhizobium sp. 200 TaxID=2782665 RepID=UPI0020004FD2|nr:hypothetical protein [Bradyrhizobium sp. 200]UPJ51245.1 hypothetical protein IVB30_07810 [Bradyrhizobium sp. 200]